jgi:uncharacterized membrane protein YdjX (TVP38/TMEM64 family)
MRLLVFRLLVVFLLLLSTKPELSVSAFHQHSTSFIRYHGRHQPTASATSTITTAANRLYLLDNTENLTRARQYHHCTASASKQQQQRRRLQPLHVTRSKFDFTSSTPPPILPSKKLATTRHTTTIKKSTPSSTKSSKQGDALTESASASASASSTTKLGNAQRYLVPIGLLTLTGLVTYGMTLTGMTMEDILTTGQQLVQDPQGVLQKCVHTIDDMGPMGIVYFGIAYVIAEVLAIPAIPLTVSAGYLFGLPLGVSVVLLSATIAASISFWIGKTVLRSFVEEYVLQTNPEFAKIDRLIGERGFQLLLVLRLSPLFPFALSNYVYGASSIDYGSYFWATLLGFAPGTIAFVYTGMVGKELLFNADDVNHQPWYVYGIGFTVVLTLMKLISDTASEIFQAADADDDNHLPRLDQ